MLIRRDRRGSTTPLPGNGTASASTAYLVKLSLTLPGITLSNFTPAVQLQFRTQIANLVGVAVNLVSISYGYSSNRRLLVAGLAVNVTIQTASSGAANTAVGALTASALNSAMAAIGLPNPIVTVPPFIIAQSTPTSMLGRGNRPSRGAAVLVLPFLLAAAVCRDLPMAPAAAGGTD